MLDLRVKHFCQDDFAFIHVYQLIKNERVLDLRYGCIIQNNFAFTTRNLLNKRRAGAEDLCQSVHPNI
jgi:hypothetical protein